MENKKITPEMLEKVYTASSVKELVVRVKECWMNLSEEKAQKYFDRIHPPVGELADEELGNVAGGGCGGAKTCPVCGGTDFKTVQAYEHRPGWMYEVDQLLERRTYTFCSNCNELIGVKSEPVPFD